MASVAILEGLQMPRHRRRRHKGRRAAMKACAKHHKVTSQGFHACVRRKTRGRFGDPGRRRRRHRRRR